jgi:multiple sugar transport system substrate-binding protein
MKARFSACAAMAALSAASLLFAGAAHAETDIQLWTLLSGGDGARMKQLVDGFNGSQKDVKVTTTTLKWGEPFYTKVKTAAAVGEGPDVVTIHLSRLSGLAQTGVLRPISQAEFDASTLKGSDFFDKLWAKAHYQDKLYAVPLDTHALVLYYNKDLIKKAGLADADGKLKPISNINELSAAFKAVKDKTGAAGFTMENAQDSYNGAWRLWLTMIDQQGGKIIDNNTVSYGKPGQQALQTMTDWYAQGLGTKGLDYGASTSEFIAGKAGFMINGVWEVPTLVDDAATKKLGFDYGVIPLPSLYNGKQSVWADSHAFAIPDNKGKPIAPDHVKAVLAFVNYVEQHAIVWGGGGHIPAYKPVTLSDQFKQMKPNSDYAQIVAEHVTYDPDGWWSGAAGPLEAAAAKYFPAAMSGQLPVDRALKMFDSDANKLLKRSAP